MPKYYTKISALTRAKDFILGNVKKVEKFSRQ